MYYVIKDFGRSGFRVGSRQDSAVEPHLAEYRVLSSRASAVSIHGKDILGFRGGFRGFRTEYRIVVSRLAFGSNS